MAGMTPPAIQVPTKSPILSRISIAGIASAIFFDTAPVISSQEYPR